MPESFRATTRTWVKLFVNEWLTGSTRFELVDPAHRAVFIDMIAMAGRSPVPGTVTPGRDPHTGEVRGYPLEWFSNTLVYPRDCFTKAIELCEKWGKVRVARLNVDGREEWAIEVVNFSKYQSEYQRQKPYRKEEQQPELPGTPPAPEPETPPPKPLPVAEKKKPEAAKSPAPAPPPPAPPPPVEEVEKDVNTPAWWERRLAESQNKAGILGDLAVMLSGKDVNYGQVASLCRSVSDDYSYVAVMMWRAALQKPAGDFVNYVGGAIRNAKLRGQQQGGGIPQRPPPDYDDRGRKPKGVK